MSLFHSLGIIKNEGLKTFNQVLKEKILLRESDDKRYERYIADIEPELKMRWKKELNKSDIDICLDIIPDSKMDLDGLIKEFDDRYKDVSYLGFIEKDDLLEQDALEQLAGFIDNCKRVGRNVDFLYTDEDAIVDGKRMCPRFKPEYSEDTLISYNYIGGLWIAKKELIKRALAKLIGEDSNLNYKLLLTLLVGQELEVMHINQIMLHRAEADLYKKEQPGLDAFKQKLLNSLGRNVVVKCDSQVGDSVTHAYYKDGKGLVSIIIPSKDNPEILKRALQSICKNTLVSDYEIVVVDNGSSDETCKSVKAMLSELECTCNYIYDKRDFNFSYMCNVGARHAKGDMLLFLNDDIEVLEHKHLPEGMDWLSTMVGQLHAPGVGAVGAKLKFPEGNRLQHIGIINYELGGFVHLYSGYEDNSEVKEFRNYADYDVISVTGACLLVKRCDFDAVGGFDEKLVVTQNDVDVCLSLLEKGKRSVIRNDVILIHHESFTRGTDEDEEKRIRSLKERDYLFDKHPKYEDYDPFYNHGLSQIENDYRINARNNMFLYKKPESVDAFKPGKERKSGDECIIKITLVEYREDLHIAGFAYDERGAMEASVYLYNDKNCYRLNVDRVCHRVFHLRKGISKHLNYAPFRALVDTSEIEPGIYKVRVSAKNGQWIEYEKSLCFLEEK